MLYFDRISEEHFGTIRQQVWASMHFFLHVTLVLVLQGISYLVMWVVALMRMDRVDQRFRTVEAHSLNGTFANGTAFASELRHQIDTYLWNMIPKGVDASKALQTWNTSLAILKSGYDHAVEDPANDPANTTASQAIADSLNTAESMAIQNMFDSLAISVPKADKKGIDKDKKKTFDKLTLLSPYEDRFELVFDDVFLSAGLALTFMAIIAFVSLPTHHRHIREYIRLTVKVTCGFTICLICPVSTSKPAQKMYMESSSMLPTICLIFFVCVVARHVRPW